MGFDLVIAHPPCTYLSNSGLCWLYSEPGRVDHMIDAAGQYRRMRAARAPFVATENPKMHRHARSLIGGAFSQYVHPWQHGTGHTKPTGLELRGLPPLVPTRVVAGREHAMANLSSGPDRGQRRSRTYVGIAAAMALQWMPTARSRTPSAPTARTRRQMMEKISGRSHGSGKQSGVQKPHNFKESSMLDYAALQTPYSGDFQGGTLRT